MKHKVRVFTCVQMLYEGRPFDGYRVREATFAICSVRRPGEPEIFIVVVERCSGLFSGAGIGMAGAAVCINREPSIEEALRLRGEVMPHSAAILFDYNQRRPLSLRLIEHTAYERPLVSLLLPEIPSAHLHNSARYIDRTPANPLFL